VIIRAAIAALRPPLPIRQRPRQLDLTLPIASCPVYTCTASYVVDRKTLRPRLLTLHTLSRLSPPLRPNIGYGALVLLDPSMVSSGRNGLASADYQFRFLTFGAGPPVPRELVRLGRELP
jgi:hypothetical protein